MKWRICKWHTCTSSWDLQEKLQDTDWFLLLLIGKYDRRDGKVMKELLKSNLDLMACEIQSVRIAKETSIKRLTVKQNKNALGKKPSVWLSNFLLILQKDQRSEYSVTQRTLWRHWRCESFRREGVVEVTLSPHFLLLWSTVSIVLC